MQQKITIFFKGDNESLKEKNSHSVGLVKHILVGNSNNKEIIYINARSLLANLNKIKIMCKSLKPKILICSEARITNEINFNEFNINGYKCDICYSNSRATGGVAIYVKKPMKHRLIESKSIDEICWYITIEIIECDMKGIYSGFYRSPNANPNESTNLFNEFIENTVSVNKLNIISGDLNFDFNVVI